MTYYVTSRYDDISYRYDVLSLTAKAMSDISFASLVANKTISYRRHSSLSIPSSILVCQKLKKKHNTYNRLVSDFDNSKIYVPAERGKVRPFGKNVVFPVPPLPRKTGPA